METLIKIFAVAILAVGAIVILALVLSIPVWLLWNWLIPIVFPGGGIVQSITLFQALGISLLCSCLFKSSSTMVKSS